MIPDEIIEQVREAADLVGIIGEHVELKRTGSDFRGPCPFHGGTHRNFAVVPKKGMFYCYVCHEAGDIYTFFMKKLGMDYPTAVREVARRVGITIPERGGPTGPDPREPLFTAVATAAGISATSSVVNITVVSPSPSPTVSKIGRASCRERVYDDV